MPYTGDGVAGSELAIDKIATKLRLQQHGVPTAAFEILRDGARPSLPLPFVVKAPREGSSVGVFIVKETAKLDESLRAAARYARDLLVEKFVEGRELTIGIVGDQVLPVIEIRPKKPGEFYDFANKYNFLNPQAAGADHICPAPLTAGETQRVQAAALAAHRALGLEVYSRVDVFLAADGAPCVLEINTIPGMTPGQPAARSGRRRGDCISRTLSSNHRTLTRPFFPMKSKPRNERLSNSKVRKQQHLLEVTVRRDKAVSMRNRAIFAFVCKTILFVSCAVGAWIGGKELLRRFLWENPDYVLTDVRVTTDGALTREQILDAAQIVEGRNIFTFNITKARSELDTLPQVERAEIQRVLPSRIDIVETERKPIAWVTSTPEENPVTSKEAFLIDARGVVMRSKVLLPEYEHLPVITGVVLGNFAPGQRVNSFEMQAALELVRLDADNTRWQARCIDLKKGYCLEVTDGNHAKITFGLDHVDQQFERLFRYLDLIEPTKKEIQTVNLMVERNTPITFVVPESDQPPASTPKPSATPAPLKSTPKLPGQPFPSRRPVEVSPSNRPPAPSSTPGPASSHRSATPVTKPFRAH